MSQQSHGGVVYLGGQGTVGLLQARADAAGAAQGRVVVLVQQSSMMSGSLVIDSMHSVADAFYSWQLRRLCLGRHAGRCCRESPRLALGQGQAHWGQLQKAHCRRWHEGAPGNLSAPVMRKL